MTSADRAYKLLWQKSAKVALLVQAGFCLIGLCVLIAGFAANGNYILNRANSELISARVVSITGDQQTIQGATVKVDVGALGERVLAPPTADNLRVGDQIKVFVNPSSAWVSDHDWSQVLPELIIPIVIGSGFVGLGAWGILCRPGRVRGSSMRRRLRA